MFQQYLLKPNKEIDNRTIEHVQQQMALKMGAKLKDLVAINKLLEKVPNKMINQYNTFKTKQLWDQILNSLEKNVDIMEGNILINTEIIKSQLIESEKRQIEHMQLTGNPSVALDLFNEDRYREKIQQIDADKEQLKKQQELIVDINQQQQQQNQRQEEVKREVLQNVQNVQNIQNNMMLIAGVQQEQPEPVEEQFRQFQLHELMDEDANRFAEELFLEDIPEVNVQQDEQNVQQNEQRQLQPGDVVVLQQPEVVLQGKVDEIKNNPQFRNAQRNLQQFIGKDQIRQLSNATYKQLTNKQYRENQQIKFINKQYQEQDGVVFLQVLTPEQLFARRNEYIDEKIFNPDKFLKVYLSGAYFQKT